MNILFSRSPRIRKTLPQVVTELHKPPDKPTKPTFSMATLIAPIFMTVASIGLYIYMSSSRQSNSNFMMFQMVMISVMAISYTIPFFVYQSQRKKYRQDLLKRERIYRETLHRNREDFEKYRRNEELILREQNPSAIQCIANIKADKSFLWQRSPHDADFLNLRLGTGTIPSSMKVKTPKQDVFKEDPLIEEALELAKQYEQIEDVPVILPFNKAAIVGMYGERKAILNSVRNSLIELAIHHSPDEVKLVSFYSEEEAREWDWMRWLPHGWNDARNQRYLATNLTDARNIIDSLYSIFQRRKNRNKQGSSITTELPWYVIVIDNSHLLENETLLPLLLEEAQNVGASIFLLAEGKEILPRECHALLEVSNFIGNLKTTNYLSEEGMWDLSFQTDDLSVEMAEHIARVLAPVRLRASKTGKIPDVLTMMDLLQSKHLSDMNVACHWAENRFPNTLPVPVGVNSVGKRFELNIHDKIERMGHGPHGLIAGTTGSGKSEVIQSFLASLAIRYHPHDISFLLIDYKGGGMSNTFEGLPHLVGSITNLDGSLIERAKVSLRAELMRRETIFKEAGNVQHIDEYYKSAHREQNPLPHLVIVVDEFAELKKEQPEFMSELISIAAKGRTLGVHLILATQKPSGVVDDKIWSNSRFRICLRVQEEADSRDMLKIPNAAWITTPGRGYLQVGSNELLELVQFAWSGAPYRPGAAQATSTVMNEVSKSGKRIPVIYDSVNEEEVQEVKQLQVIVEYLGEQAKEMDIDTLAGPWLPPLPQEIFLDELSPSRGNWLEPVVGFYDNPANQQQDILTIPLHEGHLPVYGMPGTGKTSFVQTLLYSLAQQHTPEEVQMYVLDFGDMFRDFMNLPHVGAVIREDETDRMKRCFRFLQQEMIRRRKQMSTTGIKTFTAYRDSLSEPVPALVVVLDGYLILKKNFEEEHNEFEQLLRAGGSFGIHFIVTTNQVNDIYDRVRSNFPLGISFELADPSDYYFAVGRVKAPLNMPEGRGYIKGSIPPLEFQAALPIQGEDELQRAQNLRQAMQQLNQSWTGMRPVPIQTLPEVLTLDELLEKQPKTTSKLTVPVAIAMDELIPYSISLSDGPYFVVGSPTEGGKTSFLQAWILSLASNHSPQELEVYAMDLRSSDQGISVIREIPHMKGYISHQSELPSMLEMLEEKLENRNVSDAMSHPAIFFVIDDADYFSKQLDDYALKDRLMKIISQGRRKNFYAAIAGVPSNFPYSSNDWLSEIRGAETGFLFSTLDSNDLGFLKIPYTEARSPHMPKTLRAGEGYYAKKRFTRIKGASPFSNKFTPDKWVEHLQRIWK
ncbi:DNA segregation ATPase FtsK/SpoIIIE, S-DNA-T family [Thermoactinomyces sp. DSM 45891]|uniref:type VII secretion protein EssC n=1 Tax=Thermoactinomyces sp. DSM 45891 TaxID=1761907 RepID=UPI00090F715C|nr:type VII secretion protein EssC [Thermoactinomyces sp. DSM 45891]SFX76129.1 DNA segregation ATPase FtsK/SpoIIIE, S-DNA-T family [Thermoactinomyces sp. DSM 45891]